MGALSALKKAKPLVSKFDEALANLTRPKGTGTEFLTEVMKQPGVKKAEIEDRKLKQAFEKAGKITKEQAQEIARKNASPKIEEKILTEQGEKFDELEKMAERDYGQAFEDLHPSIQDEIEKEFDSAAAQYGEYRMPGGSNYREIVMKLPTMPEAEKERLMQLEAKHRRLSEPAQWVFEDSAEGKEMKALKDKAQQSAYYSSHWGKDEANPLAHMRVQDRVGPNGEKILHVEEIQSDWHQAGRKKGYKETPNTEGWSVKSPNPYDPSEVIVYDQDGKAVWTGTNRFGTDRQIIENVSGKLQQDKVPDAPFKKNWHELAMKRLINHAAENGYDKIAITPGAEQASRYNLAKQVEQITASQEDGKFRIFARDLQGKNHDMGAFEPDKLSDVVGKDLATKISSQEKPYDIYQGVDLEVGGEGMKGFYDKMLPDYLNTLGKKHGSQVSQIEIEVPTANEDATEVVMKKTPLHSFDITPELREEVTTKGLPLYQQIGMPLGAGAAAEGLGLPSAEPEYAAGGAVNYNTDPDMSDGGEIIQGAPYKKGGKVRITDNLDEMFMEVNNKKFQRK